MRRWITVLVAFNSITCATPGLAQDTDGPDGTVAQALKKLGANIMVDRNQPGQPIVTVHLHSKMVKDADLAVLKPLPKLRALHISAVQVTDQGLEHLRGLKSLE